MIKHYNHLPSLFTSSSFLALFPFKNGRGWTDIHLHTWSCTCNNSAGITDVDRDVCTHTLLLFICSATSPLYSLELAQVVPVVFTSLSPPVSKAFTDCLTDGVPGPLYRSLCPALCPLQLAVLASCSPFVAVSAPKQLVYQPISALFPAHSPFDQLGMNTSISSKIWCSFPIYLFTFRLSFSTSVRMRSLHREVI